MKLLVGICLRLKNQLNLTEVFYQFLIFILAETIKHMNLKLKENSQDSNLTYD